MTGAPELRLLLPRVRSDANRRPFDYLADLARRLERFLSHFRQVVGRPLPPSPAEAAVLAPYLARELPGATRALRTVVGSVEGTLCIGDPRYPPLCRIAADLEALDEIGADLGRRLPHLGADDWRGFATAGDDLARRLTQLLSVVRHLVLPLARRRLAERQVHFLGRRLAEDLPPAAAGPAPPA
jgi:hypothetical protein